MAPPRRAAAMAAVLACLLVIMMIAGTLVRSMTLYHRQVRTETMQLQALWLSEAAGALAVAQLHADPGYAGQTWKVTVDETTATMGVAQIQVQPVAEQPQRRVVQVKSIYPDDPIHRVVLDSQITVTLPALGDSE